MTDYDPNRDFRDPNRLNEMQTPNWEAEREANAANFADTSIDPNDHQSAGRQQASADGPGHNGSVSGAAAVTPDG